jgi:polynucleotide 5'-hydroxyl-kinase GRC3/NOL9
LCFKGYISCGLIYGNIQINGFKIRNINFNKLSIKWYDLFSPETNAFITISNKQSEIESDQSLTESSINLLIQNVITTLSLSNVNETSFNEFLRINNFSLNNSSLIILKSLNSKICNYLSHFKNLKVLYQNNSDTQQSKSDLDNLLQKIGIFPISSNNLNNVSIESTEDKCIINNLLNVEENNLIIMACGGKDVGKSTFLRYFVNSLLNKYDSVAYIDCDPGQCEFTLSGCISLNILSSPILGPPHTHLNHINNINSYFLGYLSPSEAG